MSAEDNVVPLILSAALPRRVFHLVVFREAVRLGSCLLNVTTEELGIVALFDMWVAVDERRQGVGAALVHAACEPARTMGCNHVMLNATAMGEPVYRRAGFHSMG